MHVWEWVHHSNSYPFSGIAYSRTVCPSRWYCTASFGRLIKLSEESLTDTMFLQLCENQRLVKLEKFSSTDKGCGCAFRIPSGFLDCKLNAHTEVQPAHSAQLIKMPVSSWHCREYSCYQVKRWTTLQSEESFEDEWENGKRENKEPEKRYL